MPPVREDDDAPHDADAVVVQLGMHAKRYAPNESQQRVRALMTVAWVEDSNDGPLAPLHRQLASTRPLLRPLPDWARHSNGGPSEGEIAIFEAFSKLNRLTFDPVGKPLPCSEQGLPHFARRRRIPGEAHREAGGEFTVADTGKRSSRDGAVRGLTVGPKMDRHHNSVREMQDTPMVSALNQSQQLASTSPLLLALPVASTVALVTHSNGGPSAPLHRVKGELADVAASSELNRTTITPASKPLHCSEQGLPCFCHGILRSALREDGGELTVADTRRRSSRSGEHRSFHTGPKWDRLNLHEHEAENRLTFNPANKPLPCSDNDLPRFAGRCRIRRGSGELTVADAGCKSSAGSELRSWPVDPKLDLDDNYDREAQDVSMVSSLNQSQQRAATSHPLRHLPVASTDACADHSHSGPSPSSHREECELSEFAAFAELNRITFKPANKPLPCIEPHVPNTRSKPSFCRRLHSQPAGFQVVMSSADAAEAAAPAMSAALTAGGEASLPSGVAKLSMLQPQMPPTVSKV